MSSVKSIARGIRNSGFRGKIALNAPLANYTTYKIGGPADILCQPSCEEDIIVLISICSEKNLDVYVIGGGSKILAPDDGVRGVVIMIGELMNQLVASGDEINVMAGAKNKSLALKCAQLGIGSMEFIYDIPGRIGGSVVQNAGMKDQTISDNLSSVTFITVKGGKPELKTLHKSHLAFGYRTSSFKEWKNCIILSARFDMSNCPRTKPEEIMRKMEEIKAQRNKKFPCHQPSCGSVFKRPEGRYPGKLIEICSLGGTQIGGAQISKTHHNFFVNMGNAKASDIKSLVELTIEKVREKTGITLERELIYMEEARLLV